MNKKGFTYIETVISIMVFAIIVSIFIVSYKNFTDYSERSEVKNIVQLIKKARVSAIMQSTDITVNLSEDEIIVSDINSIKMVYELKYVKVIDSQSYKFTAQGGTKALNDVYYFKLKSNKSNRKYKVIIAAVGGQVRYEEE